MREFIIRYLPFIQHWWQIFKAYKDVCIQKESYSQHGEDVFINQILKNKDLSKGVYIDVGANHPTSLSNTYFFYKKGYSGILIEPNTKLSRLLKKIRKRDIVLSIGIGKEPAIAEYKHSTNHLLNSFNQTNVAVIRSEYIPIMPLNVVVESIINTKWIFLLSVDVEGNDFEVLQGSVKILSKTFLVVVEANNDEEGMKIEEYMNTNNFSIIKKSGCNLIFQNNNLVLNEYI